MSHTDPGTSTEYFSVLQNSPFVMVNFLSFVQWEGYGKKGKQLRTPQEMDLGAPFSRMDLARKISEEMKNFVLRYDVSTLMVEERQSTHNCAGSTIRDWI